MAADGWVLYLLRCKGDSLYAGITNNLDKRYAAHCQGKGAAYTRGHPPIALVGVRYGYPDRAAASRDEYRLKALPRNRKIQFLNRPGAGESDVCAN